MIPTQITSVGSLAIYARHERTKTTGAILVGGASQSKSFNPATHTGYPKRFLICTTSATGTIDLTDGTATGSAAYVPPVAQVRQVVATGDASGGGNLLVTVTSALLGAPKVVSVKVSGAIVAAGWAGLVRTALAASTDIAKFFAVSGATDTIILTTIIDEYGYATDAAFDIDIAAGTVPGVTPSSSTNVASGSLATGVLIDEVLGVDAEGFTLPTLASRASVMNECIRGAGSFYDSGVNFMDQSAGAVSLLFGGSGSDGMNTTMTFECTTPPYEVVSTIVSQIA